jgi:signal transduction histidine kinase
VQYIDYNVGFLQESFGELLALLDVGVRLGQAVRDGLGDGVLLALAEELHQAAAEHDLDYLRREVPASLANCLTGIAQVGGIVRGMRRFSHPGEGRPSAVDVNRCLEHTIAVSRNEWKNAAVLEFTPQPDLPAVQGWPGDLTQAFLNLLLNAAQALEEESAQGRQGRGRILVSTRLDRDRVEVVVQDNGPGISPELQSRVFEPFFTTKPPGRGTGQGLAVVHAVVVEKHGGEVRLESEPGRGARFVVRLPLDRADSAES